MLKKGKFKDYDKFNNIIYDLNNGKGLVKEYDYYSRLKFEGEYLKGERNGKEKEYNNDGKLVFEGEYLNAKRNGKGKEYNNDGKLVFESEYLYNYKIKGKHYINRVLEFKVNLDLIENGMEKDMIKMAM